MKNDLEIYFIGALTASFIWGVLLIFILTTSERHSEIVENTEAFYCPLTGEFTWGDDYETKE